MRLKRRAINLEYRKNASWAVAQHFIQSPLFTENKRFACYLATSDELDIRLIIQTIWRANKYCYLPIVTPQKTLKFGLYLENTALEPNNYGILEPHDSALIEPQQLDVVLMPLLAFDLKGHRLGTGGGFYDRTFGFLNSPSRPAQPLLVGMGFETQKLDSIISDDFDVRLNAAITEQGLIMLMFC